MEIVYSQHAKRSIRKLPREWRGRILDVVERLAGDWRGLDVKRLEGRSEWRLKAPPLRVLFRRDRTTLTIVEIGFRKDVYR